MSPLSWNLALGLERNVGLAPFTTLKAGGPAEMLYRARSVDDLSDIAAYGHREGVRTCVLGSGSNVLPSDDGVPGLVILNETKDIEAGRDGLLAADSGAWFQDVFLRAAQSSLAGLEFAVGIPGTLGGALVSNAGAYRSNISEFLTRIEIVEAGERRWVEPSYLQFSYRDSILRRPDPPPIVLLRVEMKLPVGNGKAIYDEAREYQRQRISKQPPQASAGSFFKNVLDLDLSHKLPGLPEKMREAGVVPAGYLIEAVGLKGHRVGGAALGARHANFMLNMGGAKAFEIRRLAELAKCKVLEKFGVELEEEVLYLGDWSGYRRATER